MEKNNIISYWNQRAEGYSLANQEQLHFDTKEEWQDLLQQHAPRKDKLKCLDIGCGPGFLAILLAKMGHDVYAVDYTENMLEHAKQNAASEDVAIDFKEMDAQQLAFEDNSFDYIVSRNLTWNLEHPEQAYREWLRVLKPAGRILNCDGNHYLHQHNPSYQQYRESKAYADPHKKEHMQGIDVSVMEQIATQLPLSKVERPSWDLSFLHKAGVKKTQCEVERTTFHTPEGKEQSIVERFYICVEK